MVFEFAFELDASLTITKGTIHVRRWCWCHRPRTIMKWKDSLKQFMCGSSICSIIACNEWLCWADINSLCNENLDKPVSHSKSIASNLANRQLHGCDHLVRVYSRFLSKTTWEMWHVFDWITYHLLEFRRTWDDSNAISNDWKSIFPESMEGTTHLGSSCSISFPRGERRTKERKMVFCHRIHKISRLIRVPWTNRRIAWKHPKSHPYLNLQ